MCSVAFASPPVDNVWAMMIIWRIRGKIIGTFVYDSCAQWYTQMYEQFYKLTNDLGLDLL